MVGFCLQRLKQNLRENIFFALAIFFSMAIISLLVFFELQILITKNVNFADLPLSEFVDKLRSFVRVTIVFLVVITLLTVRIHCSMKNQDNIQTLS